MPRCIEWRWLALLPAVLLAHVALADVPDPVKVAAGADIYDNYCQTCHGEHLRNNGHTFDLRRLREDERDRFEHSVTNGKGQMPPWRGVLAEDDIENLWNFIRANAYER